MSGDGLQVRLPTWETFLLNGGEAIAESGVPLTSDQRKLVEKLFQKSVDVSRIRTTSTKIASIGNTAAMVWGNTILVNPSQTLKGALLAHESTHVWQYQTSGARYLSDATLHRSYRVKLKAGESIDRYEPEQQATIVENFYLLNYEKTLGHQFALDNLPKKRTKKDLDALSAELDRLMTEIRSRRPMLDLTIRQDLNRAMTGSGPYQPPPSPLDLGDRAQPTYQLELRFNMPWDD